MHADHENAPYEGPVCVVPAVSECEKANNCPATQLRETLAREEALLHEKDELIRQEAVLSAESNHRLLNGLQMIESLLSLQSREAANEEVAAQLSLATNRVAMIERVHRRLHGADGSKTVALKRYLDDLCRDFSAMVAEQKSLGPRIDVEGIEIEVPTATGIPIGFIVNELITNAAKYGSGHITVNLEQNPGNGLALSVSNDGPALPEGFDPATSKGLGMKIVRSFVARVGGELRFGRANGNQGARFTLLFA